MGKIVVALYRYVPHEHVEEGEEDLAESELTLEPGEERPYTVNTRLEAPPSFFALS